MRTPASTPARAWLRLAAVAMLLADLAAAGCARAAQLDLELAVDGLERPVDLVTAPGDSRLYIVEQPGRIRVLENGRLRKETFLDISGQVSRGNEQGLLSVAFHPRFAANGLLYVKISAPARMFRKTPTRIIVVKTTPCAFPQPLCLDSCSHSCFNSAVAADCKNRRKLSFMI
jgi:glucose/arabinose dehydrogenase